MPLNGQPPPLSTSDSTRKSKNGRKKNRCWSSSCQLHVFWKVWVPIFLKAEESQKEKNQHTIYIYKSYIYSIIYILYIYHATVNEVNEVNKATCPWAHAFIFAVHRAGQAMGPNLGKRSCEVSTFPMEVAVSVNWTQLDSIGFISVVLFMFYLCSIYVLFMFYLFSSADCFDSVAVRCKCIRFVCIILYIYYSPPFPPAEKSGKFLIRWKNSFTTEARTKAQSFLALSSQRTWSSAKVLPHKPHHQLIKHPTNQQINKSNQVSNLFEYYQI